MHLRALTALMAIVAAACGSGSPSPAPLAPVVPTPPTPIVRQALVVYVEPFVLGVGERARAEALLSPSLADVTQQTSWTSRNPSLATVTASGEVLAIASGKVEIEGTYAGQVASGSVQVITAADIVRMLIGPVADPEVTIAVNQTLSYAPGLVLVPGNVLYVLDPPTRATYASSDPATATIAADGMVTAVAPGTTDITASFLGKSATEHLVVTPPGTR